MIDGYNLSRASKHNTVPYNVVVDHVLDDDADIPLHSIRVGEIDGTKSKVGCAAHKNIRIIR